MLNQCKCCIIKSRGVNGIKVPELLDTAQVGLDERPAVRFVSLDDFVLEAPETEGLLHLNLFHTLVSFKYKTK